MRPYAADPLLALLGGNTTRSTGPIVLDCCVIGRVAQERVKFRSGARPGDLVCVAGELGASGGGLKLLLEGVAPRSLKEVKLIEAHKRPRPQLREGQWLGGNGAVHAMIDLSDGLAGDLRRMAACSQVGFEIDLEAIPISDDLRGVSTERGWDPLALALSGGEDYVLLLTVDSGQFADLQAAFLKELSGRLFPIGCVTADRGEIRFLQAGEPTPLLLSGFDHFKRGTVS